jgi:hypothetical protein
MRYVTGGGGVYRVIKIVTDWMEKYVMVGVVMDIA